jgi:GNAT superfamily N-acetyltransferase
VATDFKSSNAAFSIRPADVTDAKAVRMLLPALREISHCFVGVDTASQRIVGAAGATVSCRTQPAIGPGIAVEVIRPYRRRGIATALLQQLENAARQTFGAAALYAASRVERGCEEAEGWEGLAFQPIETVEEHQLPTAQFEAQLGPLIDRMREKGRIPANASLIPLYEANAAAVLQLHLDQMGGDRGELYRKIRGQGVGAFHPRYSRVLLIDGRVKGCILAHRLAKDVAAVDANILDPSVRGGWANVWLKLEATRGALRLGIKTFQFTTFDHYSDTRSFTERLGGQTTRVMQLVYRPIAASL